MQERPQTWEQLEQEIASYRSAGIHAAIVAEYDAWHPDIHQRAPPPPLYQQHLSL